MSTPLTTLRPWLEPAVGAVFFALWCVAEAGRYHPTASVFVLALFSASIAVARVQPVAAITVVASAILLQVASVLPSPESTTWPVYLAVLIVAFVVAHDAPPRVGWVALGLGLPISVAIAALLSPPLPGQLARWTSWTGQGSSYGASITAFYTAAFVGLGLYVGAWALGFALRLNVREMRARTLLRRTTAQLGAAEVELLVTRERDRIARDVHDVLAHSLAVVIAQADGARFISSTRPERTDAALRAIADAARSALVDVRTLVEGMRDEQHDLPQPTLADLDPLLAQLTSAGMTVETTHFGEPKAMTPSQHLAVFRILQESLTNALRHAGRSAATRLSFDWRGPGLALTVTTTGVEQHDDDATGADGGSGQGIRGMKDRARLAGGWLTAGASAPEHEFVVTVFIPTGDDPVRPARDTPAARPDTDGLTT